MADPIQHKGAAKTARIPIKIVPQERMRMPAWIRAKAPSLPNVARLKASCARHNLHTVCEEASCPNLGECFGHGTATFMILGDLCTRRCPFCDVGHGTPLPPDADEPRHLARNDRDDGAEIRGHHQRRSRRPARRRRAAFHRLHPGRARVVAHDPDRNPDSGFPRPPRSRAGYSRRLRRRT